jgi:hypothetical protein
VGQSLFVQSSPRINLLANGTNQAIQDASYLVHSLEYSLDCGRIGITQLFRDMQLGFNLSQRA